MLNYSVKFYERLVLHEQFVISGEGKKAAVPATSRQTAARHGKLGHGAGPGPEVRGVGAHVPHVLCLLS